MNEDRIKVVKTFAEGLSVKGIPKAIKSKQWFLKVLWVGAVIVGTGICLLQLIPLLVTYSSFPTTVKMREVHRGTLFPDVTVCNLNTYTYALPTNITYWHYLDMLSRDPVLMASIMGDDDTRGIASWLLTKSAYFQFIQRDLIPERMFPELFIKDAKYEIWLHARRAKLLEYNEIVENYTSFIFDPRYGPCYTFHLQTEHDKNITEAFNAIFYLFDEDNSAVSFAMGKFLLDSKLSYASGLRVLVHEAGSYPDMSRGISVAPGTETTLRMDMERRYRLTEPYNTCNQDPYLLDIDGNTSYTYTYEDCISHCYQSHVIDTCGCITQYLMTTQNQIDSFPFCEEYNETNVLSTYDSIFCALGKLFRDSEQDGGGICNCEVPCDEIIYHVRSDSAPWPHEKHHFMFYTTYIQDDPFITKYTSYNLTAFEQLYNDYFPGNDNYVLDDLREIDFIRRNFVQVIVKLAQSTVTEIVEQPALTLESIMGTVGGLFNLWIGITFITLIEFVEFLYKFICVKTEEDRKTKVRPLT